MARVSQMRLTPQMVSRSRSAASAVIDAQAIVDGATAAFG